ncbi:unnamed protein product [Ectocarpus sp. 12 AP-2014]
MIENLPFWINLVFLFTVALTIGIFHFANGKSTRLTLFILFWSLGQSVLAFTGFYQKPEIIPPRFLLVIIPVFIILIFGLAKKPKNWILKYRNTKLSTFLHTVRIPVEIVIYYLFTYSMLPELMTFKGRNYDIIAGMTAPIFGFLWLAKTIGRKAVIIWNIISLLLVLFIFANGILSSELPIQLLGFEQPNRAVNYFPFILLPATVVPIVIYTHITDILALRKQAKT